MEDSAVFAAPLVVLILFGVFFVVLYFLPAYIACYRGHPEWPAIAVVNIVFGWSFIGWGVALVWAMTSIDRRRPPVVIVKHQGPAQPMYQEPTHPQAPYIPTQEQPRRRVPSVRERMRGN